MAPANTDVIQDMVEAFNSGELHRILEFVDEYSCWIPLEGHPDMQPAIGPEGVLEFMRQWLEAWDWYEFETVELFECNQRVVWVARNKARHSSGMEMDVEFSGLFAITAGKVVQARWFRERGEAVEAAGARVS